MYVTYVLQSQKDNKYYIGHTADMTKRLQQHNDGLNRSTAYRRPLVLIYQEQFLTRTAARQRENFLKKQKGGDVFKRIISQQVV